MAAAAPLTVGRCVQASSLRMGYFALSSALSAVGRASNSTFTSTMKAAGVVGCCLGSLTMFGTGIAAGLQSNYLWGRHDKSTKKGKIHIGTYGLSRKKNPEPGPYSREYNQYDFTRTPPHRAKPPRNDQ
eukprot:746656-Hanusia_phi.AAC.2